MRNFKTFAVTALAVATIGVGGLAAAPSAEAKPRMTCETALALSKAYIATGDIFYAHGDSSNASKWYGKASGVVQGAC
jgi:hypothetical protein